MKEDIIILDDFLTPSYHQYLLDLVLSPNMSWYYNKNISVGIEKNVDLDKFGFTHTVFGSESSSSSLHLLLLPFLWKIKDLIGAKEVIRCRLDMTVYNPNNYLHERHIDINTPHYVAIYYVNDSDGETIIYNQKQQKNKNNFDLSIRKKIEPKANRILIFNGEYFHTGHSPSKNSTRILINSNFVK